MNDLINLLNQPKVAKDSRRKAIDEFAAGMRKFHGTLISHGAIGEQEFISIVAPKERLKLIGKVRSNPFSKSYTSNGYRYTRQSGNVWTPTRLDQDPAPGGIQVIFGKFEDGKDPMAVPPRKAPSKGPVRPIGDDRESRLIREAQDIAVSYPKIAGNLGERSKNLESQSAAYDRDSKGHELFDKARVGKIGLLGKALEHDYKSGLASFEQRAASIDPEDPEAVDRLDSEYRSWGQEIRMRETELNALKQRTSIESQAKEQRLGTRRARLVQDAKSFNADIAHLQGQEKRMKQIRSALAEKNPQVILKRMIALDKVGNATEARRLAQEYFQPGVNALAYDLPELQSAMGDPKAQVNVRTWESANGTVGTPMGQLTALNQFSQLFGTKDRRAVDVLAKYTTTPTRTAEQFREIPAPITDIYVAAKNKRKFVVGWDGKEMRTEDALLRAHEVLGTKDLKGLHRIAKISDVPAPSPEMQWRAFEDSGGTKGVSTWAATNQKRAFLEDPSHWQSSYLDDVLKGVNKGFFSPVSMLDDEMRSAAGDDRRPDQLPAYHQVIRTAGDFLFPTGYIAGAAGRGLKAAMLVRGGAEVRQAAALAAIRQTSQHAAEYALKNGTKAYVGYVGRQAAEELAEESTGYIQAIRDVQRQYDLPFSKAVDLVNKEYGKMLTSVEWADSGSKMSAGDRVSSFLNQASILRGATHLTLQAPSVKRRVVAAKFGLEAKSLSHDDVDHLAEVASGLDEMRRQGMTPAEARRAAAALGSSFTETKSRGASPGVSSPTWKPIRFTELGKVGDTELPKGHHLATREVDGKTVYALRKDDSGQVTVLGSRLEAEQRLSQLKPSSGVDSMTNSEEALPVDPALVRFDQASTPRSIDPTADPRLVDVAPESDVDSEGMMMDAGRDIVRATATLSPQAAVKVAEVSPDVDRGGSTISAGEGLKPSDLEVARRVINQADRVSTVESQVPGPHNDLVFTKHQGEETYAVRVQIEPGTRGTPGNLNVISVKRLRRASAPAAPILVPMGGVVYELTGPAAREYGRLAMKLQKQPSVGSANASVRGSRQDFEQAIAVLVQTGGDGVRVRGAGRNPQDPVGLADSGPDQNAGDSTFSVTKLDTLGKDALKGFVKKYRGTIIGRKFCGDLIRTGEINLYDQTVSDVDSLVKLAQVYRDPRMEVGRVIFVKNGKVIYETAFTSRLPNMTLLFPRYMKTAERKARRIKRLMKAYGADSYYLLHNHPAGHANPSNADIAYAKAIAQHAPEGFKGSVIIDSNQYSFINELGKPVGKDGKPVELTGHENYQEKRAKTVIFRDFGPDLLLAADIEHDILSERLSSVEAVASVGKRLMAEERMPIIIGLSEHDEVRLLLRLDEELLGILKKGGLRAAAQLSRIQRQNGVSKLNIVLPGYDVAKISEIMGDRFIAEAIDKNLIYDILFEGDEEHRSGWSLRGDKYYGQSRRQDGFLLLRRHEGISTRKLEHGYRELRRARRLGSK